MMRLTVPFPSGHAFVGRFILARKHWANRAHPISCSACLCMATPAQLHLAMP